MFNPETAPLDDGRCFNCGELETDDILVDHPDGTWQLDCPAPEELVWCV